MALLGPSGCGKTTLLRIIAGLEFADKGHVFLDGENASDRHVRERQVGFVFQHYALFRHMSVFENVAFGLRVRKGKDRLDEAEIRRRVNELLDLVQLGWLRDNVPAQLSGGQRQRIALARALAVEPRVLLLDEPFGALDAQVRKELRRWLRNLHEDLRITSIFVTHDQEEAMELADQIVVMNRGHVEQIGAPVDVYDKPATPFVYGFLGAANVFNGTVEGPNLRVGEDLLPIAGADAADGAAVRAYSRPHDLEIETDKRQRRRRHGQDQPHHECRRHRPGRTHRGARHRWRAPRRSITRSSCRATALRGSTLSEGQAVRLARLASHFSRR